MPGRRRGVRHVVRDPIWGILDHQGRGQLWLAGRTGYSHSHVRGIKSGLWPATAAFRAKCVFALDLPESVLFLPRQPRPAAAGGAEPVDVA